MKISALLLVTLLLGSGKTFAQLNESDTVKFQLRASLTGAYQQGNVEILIIKSKLDFSYLPSKNWVLKSQKNSLYQTFYSRKADNDVFSRNYLYYKPQRKVYPFTIAYISSNFRRKIDLRYFGGAGATYQIINNPTSLLKLSASAVYESSQFNAINYNYPEYDGTHEINLWRGTLYIAGWTNILDRHIRLYFDAYWQPAFNDSNNYRTQVDVGIDFPIWKGLFFNVLYAFTHENVTVSAIQQNDQILTFGLAYNFKR